MMAQKPSAPPLPLPSRPASVLSQGQLPGGFNLGSMGYNNPSNPRGNPLAGMPAGGGAHLPAGGATATDFEGLQRLLTSNPGGINLDELLRGSRGPEAPQQAFNPAPWLNNARLADFFSLKSFYSTMSEG